MNTTLTTRCALMVLAIAATPIAARAQSYPRTLTATAEFTGPAGGRTTGVMTIRIDRLMEDFEFKRVYDALQAGGYQRFLPALRSLTAIGYVQIGETRTDLKYARMRTGAKPVLVLGTDRPIFFIGGNATTSKPRAGYEMGIIELEIDAQGNGQGTMAAAARVRRVPDGVEIDDYADTPVKLTVKPAK